MATHSSTLAWKIPWTEEPGRLQSMMSREESDTTEHVHALEKEIATHPSALAQGRGSLMAFRLLQSNTTEAAAACTFNTANLCGACQKDLTFLYPRCY